VESHTTQPYAEAVRPHFSFSEQEIGTFPIDILLSDLTEVIEMVSSSVVSINIEVPSANLMFGNAYSMGAGSGIIFAQDENFVYIATNNHVVHQATFITVSFDDYEEIRARQIGGDYYTDLALISIPRSALGDRIFYPAVFGDSSVVRVGDEVVAIGNPMGGGQTSTRGIISAVNRQIVIDQDGRIFTVLQTDAAINPGNSGGALVNTRGEIIGINTAKAQAQEIEGMGYAIPSNHALTIIERLLEESTTPRPSLGITTFHIDENMRRMYALSSVGVMVIEIEESSPAYDSELMELDLIFAFNDVAIRTNSDFLNAVDSSTIGEQIVLHIYRDGNVPMEISVVVGDANNMDG